MRLALLTIIIVVALGVSRADARTDFCCFATPVGERGVPAKAMIVAAPCTTRTAASPTLSAMTGNSASSSAAARRSRRRGGIADRCRRPQLRPEQCSL